MKTNVVSRNLLIWLSSVCCFGFITPAIAQEAPPKSALCNTCHGNKGAEPIAPNYPKLNGQNKDYLVGALKAYKAGERKNAMAAVMTGQAAALSDAEIEELAVYYSAQ